MRSYSAVSPSVMAMLRQKARSVLPNVGIDPWIELRHQQAGNTPSNKDDMVRSQTDRLQQASRLVEHCTRQRRVVLRMVHQDCAFKTASRKCAAASATRRSP